MADIPRSSFIPKDVASAVPARVRRRRTFNVFGFVGSIMLIASLVLAGGVFFLKTKTQKDLEQRKVTLEAENRKFNEQSIFEVQQFDQRVQAAELLLKNHLSPSLLFEELESVTKHHVQLTKLEYEYDAPFDVLLTIGGATDAFKTLALQELGLLNSALLRSIEFTELGTSDVQKPGESTGSKTDTSGKDTFVQFTLEGNLEPALIRYENSIAGTDLEGDPEPNEIETSPALENSTAP